MNPAINNPKLTRPSLGCLRCFPSDDCPDDCRARNHGGELLAEIEELKKERDRYRSALKRIAALEREWSVQSEAVRIASEALADA